MLATCRARSSAVTTPCTAGKRHAVRLFAAQKKAKQKKAEQKKAYYALDEALEFLRQRYRDTEKQRQLFAKDKEVKFPSFEADITLRIKPKKNPNHMLIGVFDLPHGSRKSLDVAALTLDGALERQALEAGALFAGDLREDIIQRRISPTLQKMAPRDNPTYFRRLVATKDMEEVCRGANHPIAKVLKRFSISLCEDDRTLVEADDFVEAVRKHADGTYVRFQTDMNGCVFCPLGPVDEFTFEQVTENLHHVVERLYSMKPNDFDDSEVDLIKSINLSTSRMGSVALDLNQASYIPGYAY